MLVTRSRRTTAPANDLFASLRGLNRVMDEALGAWPLANGGGNTIASAWVPAVDVYEDEDSLRIVMEVPGVRAEDVKVSLENQVLSIRGEKRQEAEEQAERWHRYERSYGAFERTFTLPTTVDADRIQANVRDGVLTVTLPRVEKARPREIAVRSEK